MKFTLTIQIWLELKSEMNLFHGRGVSEKNPKGKYIELENVTQRSLLRTKDRVDLKISKTNKPKYRASSSDEKTIEFKNKSKTKSKSTKI